jgi:hypothetical protein
MKREAGNSLRMALIASIPFIIGICKSMMRDIRSMYAEHLECLLSVIGVSHHDDVLRALNHGVNPFPHQGMVIRHPYPFRPHHPDCDVETGLEP